jgi:dipeptidyl aminopeptidase/acylaminoacyl peptidase
MLRALACFVLAAAAATTAAAPPPVEAFFRAPLLESARLSPDGRRVAMNVRADGGRARLAVLDLESMQPTIVASFADADIDDVHWVNGQRLVFDLKVELTGPGVTDSGGGLFAVDVDGKAFRQLVETSVAGGFVQTVVGINRHLPWATRLLHGAPAAGGDAVWVTRPQEISSERVGYFTLQRLDTRTGHVRDAETPVHARDWLVDRSGRVRMATARQEGQVEVLLAGADGSWKPVARFAALDGDWLRPRHVGADGTLLVEASHRGASALFTLDPATGRKSAEPVLAGDGFDVHVEPVEGVAGLAGLRRLEERESTLWLTPELRALQAQVDKLLPGLVNRIEIPREGSSPWVLVHSQADRLPPMVNAFHRDTGKFARVGSRLAGLEPRQLGRMEFLRLQARDGKTIPAWLTRPAGAAPGTRLPLVVRVHGGPWSRGQQWGWDAEVQFLASRGYAVLEPEFRGSTGYGGAWFEAGFRQWGQAMQDDVTDATRWAVAQGIADPARICIAGASYGGYGALMGLLREPGLYRCGINWVGVTDPMLLFTASWSDITNEFRRWGLKAMLGDPEVDAAMFKAQSPLAQAARLTQPLLMAYGAYDVRVPIVHGEKLRDALKPHNPRVEWVVYEKEGHGWERPETRIDFWRRVETFLQRELALP